MARKKKMTEEEEEKYWEEQEERESQPGYYDNLTPEQKKEYSQGLYEADDDEADYIETQKPDLATCPCRDCEWREPDRQFSKGGEITRCATLNLCEVYGVGKPHDVLWKGEPCPYYLKEKSPKPVRKYYKE